LKDINIRITGRAGRITLTREHALNALTHDMAMAVLTALNDWRDNPAVSLVVMDAQGDRAFCAGGDIAAVYHAGRAGDHHAGRGFFNDEYQMNAAIADFPKPVVALMQGFVMGGGVGLGGHASHRIIGDTTRIAMPESGIGLIPDVGGTWLLGRAPGRIGEYLALTGARMGPGDAIHAGFADTYLPEEKWPALIAALEDTGDISHIAGDDVPAPMLADRDLSAFGGRHVADIIDAVRAAGDTDTLKLLERNSPLSMAASLVMVRAARGDLRIQESLSREFRFTARATQHSDFLEGVRAQIIDKDRSPKWTADASTQAVQEILAPLGPDEMTWEIAE
jgi:enoyl-CoA hydratase/carnithine racemase